MTTVKVDGTVEQTWIGGREPRFAAVETALKGKFMKLEGFQLDRGSLLQAGTRTEKYIFEQ